ncbi:MAG TPA: FHA domain-containing protein, partial [Steroidobacteraceae bacterium]|nr:FHA domain-containing protein [Steroidobacteraceae bacterium]
ASYAQVIGEAVLRVSIQGQPERELRFDIPRMLIGRSQSADVRIHSMYVSRHHALLVRERDHDVVIDLGSRNGVLVNSERITHHILVDRDLIQIGPAKMVYCCAGATGVVADEFAATVRFARAGEVEAGETGPENSADRVVGFGRAPRTTPSK